MNKLYECAKAFERLLGVEYHMIVGRKGKAVEKIMLSDIENSQYYDKIKGRIDPLIKIEDLFDKNNLIFRYSEKRQSFSMIEAEYLLSTPYETTDIYIFLDKKNERNRFFCRSFFPREGIDYTAGQAVYTLLMKKKINMGTGECQLQYDRLTQM